jgi:hypothetical protein
LEPLTAKFGEDYREMPSTGVSGHTHSVLRDTIFFQYQQANLIIFSNFDSGPRAAL